MLRAFAEFVVTVRFPDMVNDGWITIQMYPGNRTGTPCEYDSDGRPTRYKVCKVNLVDCGVID